MIKSLYIQNFILIDELHLDFKDGFNVITGETGAGKSIILNAIDIVLGARASKEVIKTGTEKSYIEATLVLKENFDKQFLFENGIDSLSNELVVSREITQNASRIRVNGVLVSQEFIRELREKIIDIHSQTETYTYIQQKYHINLLDSYKAGSHAEYLNNYQTVWQEYMQTLDDYNKAVEANNVTENQIDFLKFQISEIEDANITDVHEDEQIEKQLEILLNAEKLKELTYSGYYALYSDENSVISAISTIKNNISKAAEYDENINEIEQNIIEAQENLKEVASYLRNYSESIEPDEEKINTIQERKDLLDKLKRKYGGSLEEVVNNCEKFSDELKLINYSQSEIIRLDEKLKILKQQLEEAAQKLSDSRKILAKDLSQKITQELEKLELPKSRFEISVEPKEFSPLGCDEVEFMISTNISEPLKPLAKVASGGEMSRVMLAIKTIFAVNDKVDTVIFDEIDAGISGKASTSVADAISQLANTHQIIAITHQPIIAAKANQHFYVKKSQDDITSVKVYTLKEEDKIKALAILAAGDITEESLNFARQLVCS